MPSMYCDECGYRFSEFDRLIPLYEVDLEHNGTLKQTKFIHVECIKKT